MKNNFFLFFLLFTFSCSQKQPIGIKDHYFGQKGKHIIWLQVAGLEPEHLSLLKFNKDTATDLIAFEKMTCVGSMWSYNLFELRPDSNKGFISQALGSQKIKGDCSDFDRRSVWDYFQNSGYQIGVYEGPEVKEKSLERFMSCEGNFKPLGNSFLWKQSLKSKAEKTFHYQEKTGLTEPGVYYDKSCQQGACIIPLKTNVKELWKNFVKANAKTFFTVRTFALEKYLVKKDTAEVIESLNDLQELVTFFQEEAKTKSILLVVSSSAARGFELPESGNNWAQFIKRGRHINYQRTRLQGPVYAYGDGSENFCGVFEEAQILKRFIWMPQRNLFNLTF